MGGCAKHRSIMFFLAAVVCVMAVCPPLAAEDNEPKVGGVEATKVWEWVFDNREYLFNIAKKAERLYESDMPTPIFHWVCLVDHDLAWEICNRSSMTHFTSDCFENGSILMRWGLDVRTEPKHDAKRIGQILIRLTTERRETVVYVPWLRATFVPEDGGSPVDFEPDVTDLDFGYAGYFYHTFQKRSDNWFKLPKNPLPEPGWVNLSVLCPHPKMLAIAKGMAYTLGEKLIVVLEFDQSGITYRLAQEGDDPSGDQSPIQPAETFFVPCHELYDADGHLLLKVGFTRD